MPVCWLKSGLSQKWSQVISILPLAKGLLGIEYYERGLFSTSGKHLIQIIFNALLVNSICGNRNLSKRSSDHPLSFQMDQVGRVGLVSCCYWRSHKWRVSKSSLVNPSPLCEHRNTNSDVLAGLLTSVNQNDNVLTIGVWGLGKRRNKSLINILDLGNNGSECYGDKGKREPASAGISAGWSSLWSGCKSKAPFCMHACIGLLACGIHAYTRVYYVKENAVVCDMLQKCDYTEANSTNSEQSSLTFLIFYRLWELQYEFKPPLFELRFWYLEGWVG